MPGVRLDRAQIRARARRPAGLVDRPEVRLRLLRGWVGMRLSHGTQIRRALARP